MLLFQHGNLRVLQGETTYVEAAGPEGTGILLTMPDGRLLVSREYRSAVGQVVWGVPGGMLCDDETPEECARRELREEFGAEVGPLHFLAAIYPEPGLLARKGHLFCAQVISLGTSRPEADEQIQPTAITLAELQERLLAGEAADGFLPCALLYARLRGFL